MKSRSAKNKGARFQKEVKELIHEHFPEIPRDSLKVAIMGESGVDIHISPDVRHSRIPLAIECKNTEKLNIWSAIQQAELNAGDEGNFPVVFFRRNRTKPYVVLDAEDFLLILEEATRK